MANYIFNLAKGRHAEFMDRVNSNDPTNAAFIAVPLSASGTEAQGQDFNDLAAVLADANFTEITTGGWSRITLVDTDVDSAANLVDDTNNLMQTDVADIAFGTITSGTTTGILICYDSDTTSGTDANIIPVSHHDFAVTGNGSTVTATVPASGFITSS